MTQADSTLPAFSSGAVRAAGVGACVLGLYLAGCGSAPSPAASRTPTEIAAPASSERVEPAPAGERALVWTENEAGRRQSYWVVLEADGVRIERRAAGSYVHAAGAERPFLLTAEEVPLYSCDDIIDEALGTPVDRRPWQRASLGGDGGLELPLGERLDHAVNDLSHEVRLEASYGPYLFISETTWSYSCGAHGNAFVQFFVYDSNQRAVVSLLSPEELAALTEERAAAEALFRAEQGEVDDITDLRRMELVKALPAFDGAGQTTLALVFAAPTCYACTSGEWGSYFRTVRVESRSLPRALLRTPAPKVVQELVRQAGPLGVLGSPRGWSSLPPQR
ncbi:MAG: hypothetical protein KIT72_17790 [Polyangiaceae bacterium]|nr:hypothetical protein [Polyangiaceae bacterium]MCW5792268.1 hypothetical protein [Polyangiaceae bacterium]